MKGIRKMGCEICGRNNCTKFFHSAEEQESYDIIAEKIESKYGKIIEAKDFEIADLKEEINKLKGE
jgi:hypothetical protein